MEKFTRRNKSKTSEMSLNEIKYSIILILLSLALFTSSFLAEYFENEGFLSGTGKTIASLYLVFASYTIWFWKWGTKEQIRNYLISLCLVFAMNTICIISIIYILIDLILNSKRCDMKKNEACYEDMIIISITKGACFVFCVFCCNFNLFVFSLLFKGRRILGSIQNVSYQFLA